MAIGGSLLFYMESGALTEGGYFAVLVGSVCGGKAIL